MAFRPSVTWPSGQVAFIAMDTFFVPSNWTPHCLLSTNCISLGSQSLTIGHWPCAFLRAGIFGIKVIVWMLREQVCNRNKVVLGYTCREQKWNEMYFVSILKFWYNNNSSFFFPLESLKPRTFSSFTSKLGRRKLGHTLGILRMWRYEFYFTFHQVVLISKLTTHMPKFQLAQWLRTSQSQTVQKVEIKLIHR